MNHVETFFAYVRGEQQIACSVYRRKLVKTFLMSIVCVGGSIEKKKKILRDWCTHQHYA